MFFRILLMFLLGYFGYHLYQGLVHRDDSDTVVKGKQKKRPLDLKQEDVEEAKFKDVDEK